MTNVVTSSPICPSGNCCPYYDAQTQQCYTQDPNSNSNSNSHYNQDDDDDGIRTMPRPHVSRTIPRGGSTIPSSTSTSTSTSSNQEDHHDIEEEEEKDEEPIDYDSISMALRMTCELNRQLLYGTNGMTCAGGHMEQVHHLDFPDSSQSWFHSIQPPSSSTSTTTTTDTNSIEPLTMFHAKSPRSLTSSKKKRKLTLKTGCARWGPSLALYLRQLHTSLQCPPMTFALALIYLDRACSAETQRGVSGINMAACACPHLTPRTVHRLVLTAMVIASKAMDATMMTTNSEKYDRLLRTFGISEHSMQNMEAWMLQALGEKGTWVDAERMKNLWTVWQCAFSSSNHHHPTTTTTNNNEEEEGGSKQYCGIGLQKELERLYPTIHHTNNGHSSLQDRQHPSQQHPHHSQWHESSPTMTNPRVVHIRREQHIVHVQRPTNDYYHHEQPTSYTRQHSTREYAPPQEPPPQHHHYPPPHPPPHPQQHHSSDYLGPSGGYLQEESDSNFMEYYARA